MSSSTWTLLSLDLIEHQLSQIDLLMAMYPSEDEAYIDEGSQTLLDTLKQGVENNSQPSLSRQPLATMLLNLSVPDDEERSLQLDITIPFFWESDQTPAEEAPDIRVRVRQPPWLNRAATAKLNSQIPESDQDLFSTVQFIQDAAAELIQEEANASLEAAQLNSTNAAEEPLIRVWFYFPSISTRSKRDDFIINAPHYRLTGFLYAGKPGLLCLEGGSKQIDDYMKFIKTESWGDIPAHHKKVSERLREKDIPARVFDSMEEITDSVGERRGQRANRGDMKAMEGWLEERGLGDALGKVLM